MFLVTLTCLQILLNMLSISTQDDGALRLLRELGYPWYWYCAQSAKSTAAQTKLADKSQHILMVVVDCCFVCTSSFCFISSWELISVLPSIIFLYWFLRIWVMLARVRQEFCRWLHASIIGGPQQSLGLIWFQFCQAQGLCLCSWKIVVWHHT